MHAIEGELHAHLDVAVGAALLLLHEALAVRGRHRVHLNVSCLSVQIHTWYFTYNTAV